MKATKMKIPVSVIRVDGRIERKEIDGTLKELQELVGGYIETVNFNDRVIIVDEEGLCKNKEVNKVATNYAGFPLVGDVVVMHYTYWRKIA